MTTVVVGKPSVTTAQQEVSLIPVNESLQLKTDAKGRIVFNKEDRKAVAKIRHSTAKSWLLTTPFIATAAGSAALLSMGSELLAVSLTFMVLGGGASVIGTYIAGWKIYYNKRSLLAAQWKPRVKELLNERGVFVGDETLESLSFAFVHYAHMLEEGTIPKETKLYETTDGQAFKIVWSVEGQWHIIWVDTVKAAGSSSAVIPLLNNSEELEESSVLKEINHKISVLRSQEITTADAHMVKRAVSSVREATQLAVKLKNLNDENYLEVFENALQEVNEELDASFQRQIENVRGQLSHIGAKVTLNTQETLDEWAENLPDPSLRTTF